MEKEEIIRIIISAIISSSVVNALITHFLYESKLKKELRYKGNDLQAKEIEKSLQHFRELELKITVQEIYNIEDELERQGPRLDLFNAPCIYPEIFNDIESIDEFQNMIHGCRVNDEKNLNCMLALNLIYIDRYMQQVRLFASDIKLDLPTLGAILIFDLQAWQKE